MEHGSREPSKYRASEAHRWTKCHGSVRLSASAPKRAPSVYAQEGTDAHHLLEVSLKNGCRSAYDAWIEYSDFWCREHDKEMCSAVQDALDYVYGIADQYPDAVIYSERKLILPTENAPGEVGGTGDVAIYIPSIRWLWAIDFKYGQGVAVDVHNNDQLKTYGAGWAYSDVLPLADTLSNRTLDNVRLVIIQPRAFHRDGPVRECDVSTADLLDYLVYLEDQVAECEKPNAPLVPGEWCHWCNAETTCPALETRALSTVSQNFASVKDVTASKLPAPQSLPLDRLSYVLQSSELLESWLKACWDHALELARQGHNIPGLKLVRTQAKRKWYGDPTYVAQQLMVLSGEQDWDKVMPRQLIGVTDAEKLVVKAYKARVSKKDAKKAAEDAKQAMAFLTIKESSGNTTLVPLTDERPPVNLSVSNFGSVNIPDSE